MRWLRDFFILGALPPNPRDFAPSRQNYLSCFAIGAAAPNPARHPAEGRRPNRLPDIPAAESALGLRPRIALSSAQVLPEWTISTPLCNNFLLSGINPLNSVSHPRGSLHRFSRLRAPLNRPETARHLAMFAD